MGSGTKSAPVTFFGCDELANTNLWWSLLAEFVGTFFLVLVGCGAHIVLRPTDFGPIAAAFGVTVMTVILLTGHVSGGHINPAVSIGMLVTGKISLVRYLLYVLCQCAGAIVGAALLRTLTPGAMQKSLGATLVPDGVSEVLALGVEFFITFVLVLTIFAFFDPNRPDPRESASVPMSIPLAVITCHMSLYSGSSMNPARSLGPAVIMNIWSGHWIYWVGPNLGGVAAAILYPKPDPEPVSSMELLSKEEIKLKASEIENVTIDFTSLSVHPLM